MATAKELEVIHADLMIANNILYADDKSSLSPYMVNQAAYHSAQAIEKSLKAIIRAGEENCEYESLVTHNIDRLVVRAEMCSPNFIQEHRFIAENSEKLSAFNGLRYGNKGVSKADAFVLLKEAKELHRELEKEYLHAFSQDKNLLHQSAYAQYQETDRISLNTQGSKYNRKPKQDFANREG